MSKRADLPGAAHLALVQGASLLHPERAVLDAMLDGWALQQKSRLLSSTTISTRRRMVRRFQEFTNEYPWRWTPEDVEAWSASLMSAQRGPVDDPQLPGRHRPVHGLHHRLPVRVGGRVPGAVRRAPRPDLP